MKRELIIKSKVILKPNNFERIKSENMAKIEYLMKKVFA
jgi:hypothetical protein